MSKRDYYEVLGVGRNASKDELKNAFRNLARQYHPDVSKESNAEEKFKEINEAYGVLSDDQKRAAYDRFGHAGVDGMGAGPDFSNVDLNDILNELFGGAFGFGFGGGSRGRRSNMPRRGADLQYNLTLTFEEAVFGTEKDVKITRDEECGTCNGSGSAPGTSASRCSHCSGRGVVREVRQSLFGQMVQETACPVCRGAGEVISDPCSNCRGSKMERKMITRTVTIPAGVDTGNQIRLSNEGQPGTNGGPRGNLYLAIKVKPHKFFRRRENDILLDLNINVAQATLGAEVKVPTLDGDENITIPSGTQPGKVITLRNKGVPNLRGGSRGAQHIMINVQIPKKLSPEQRELFEQLAETLGIEVQPEERGFFDKLKDVLGG